MGRFQLAQAHIEVDVVDLGFLFDFQVATQVANDVEGTGMEIGSELAPAI